MTKLLSSLNNSLTFVPQPLTTALAGQTANAATDDIQPWLDKNWLECDGSAVSRTTYADLFANIGTKYGIGDGSTTFNLPDGPRRTDIFIPDFNEVAPNFTPNGTPWAFLEQDELGNWFLTASVSGTALYSTFNPQSAWSVGTFQGISVFDDGGNSIQPVTVTGTGSATNMQTEGWVVTSGNLQSQTNQNFSGNHPITFALRRIRLASKPTDALVDASDPNYTTIDEALESIPMIKAYDDSSNISMSIADATETKTGAVRLNSDFAATDSTYGFVLSDKSQIKEVNSNQTGGTGNTTLITFNNMVVGKKYRIELRANIGITSGSAASFRAFHDGTTLAIAGEFTAASVTRGVSFFNKADFTATTTTLTVDWIRSNASDILYGYPTPSQTAAKLIEINQDDTTTDFT